MRSLIRRRSSEQVDPPQDEEEHGEDDLPPIGTASQQLTSTLATKTLSAVLVGCLAAGPIAAVLGAYAVLRPASLAAAPAAPLAGEVGELAVVGEFAERATVAWLTATKDHPEEFFSLVRVAQDYALPERAFTVTNPSVARIEPAGSEIWSVTVAATVTDARRLTVRRFYRLPVSYSDGTLVALTLPSPASPPPVGDPPKTEYRTELLVDGPVGSTVGQFLGAYLAGVGDLSRYVSPGVTVTALQPVPYTAVRLTELHTPTEVDLDVPKDGQQIRVLASAIATVTAQQTLSTSYALTLTGRGGRWEISSIDPAPSTADPAATQSSSPSSVATAPADPSSSPTS